MTDANQVEEISHDIQLKSLQLQVDNLKKALITAIRVTNSGPYVKDRIDQLNLYLRQVLGEHDPDNIAGMQIPGLLEIIPEQLQFTLTEWCEIFQALNLRRATQMQFQGAFPDADKDRLLKEIKKSADLSSKATRRIQFMRGNDCGAS